MGTLKATSTVTVNAAFLKEIKDVNREFWKLLADVRRLCAEPTLIRLQRRQFVQMLTQLRDQLAMHFALEEAYGYFDDPLYVAPHFSQQAERLREEHHELYRSLCELVDYVEKLAYRGRLGSMSGHVAELFQCFDDLLDRHENDENELILEVYESDVGVGD